MPDILDPEQLTELEQTVQSDVTGELEGPVLTPEQAKKQAGELGVEELKKGFLRQADYTRKTQALGSLQQQAKQALEQAEGERDEAVAKVAELEQGYTSGQDVLADIRTVLAEGGPAELAERLGVELPDPDDDTDIEDDLVNDTVPIKVTKQLSTLEQSLAAVGQRLDGMANQQRGAAVDDAIAKGLAPLKDTLPEAALARAARHIRNDYIASGDAEKGLPLDRHIEAETAALKEVQTGTLTTWAKQHKVDLDTVGREGPPSGAQAGIDKMEAAESFDDEAFTEGAVELAEAMSDVLAQAEEGD
jgi:hypothetical protein